MSRPTFSMMSGVLRRILVTIAAMLALTVALSVSPASAAVATGPHAARQMVASTSTLYAAPTVTTRFCFSLTGPGACLKYTRADINRFERVGIIGGGVSAAAAAEYMCSLTKHPAVKTGCKAVIAGYYVEVIYILRKAQEQQRCIQAKASLNPVAALIDRPTVVDC